MALGINLASAGVIAGTLGILQEHADYVAGFPPGVISGGDAFSLNFLPIVVTLFAMGFGAFGLLLLVSSCWVAHLNRQPMVSAVHICAGVSVLPFFYLAIIFIRSILR